MVHGTMYAFLMFLALFRYRWLMFVQQRTEFSVQRSRISRRPKFSSS